MTARPLTDSEWAALSPGLAAALLRAGVVPTIIARPSVLARIASVWRRHTPVMVLGSRIFWPGAPADITTVGPRATALLQHELQHVLDFATGALSLLGYALGPWNWRYGYDLALEAWTRLGAEQRASVAEHLWLAEQGLIAADLTKLRALAPWAGEGAEEGPP